MFKREEIIHQRLSTWILFWIPLLVHLLIYVFLNNLLPSHNMGMGVSEQLQNWSLQLKMKKSGQRATNESILRQFSLSFLLWKIKLWEVHFCTGQWLRNKSDFSLKKDKDSNYKRRRRNKQISHFSQKVVKVNDFSLLSVLTVVVMMMLVSVVLCYQFFLNI